MLLGYIKTLILAPCSQLKKCKEDYKRDPYISNKLRMRYCLNFNLEGVFREASLLEID